MKYNERMTPKELMNFYAVAGLNAERLAQALEANFGDCERIMEFMNCADKCYALNKLYASITKKNARYPY